MHRAFLILTLAPLALWALCILAVIWLGLVQGCEIHEGAVQPCRFFGRDIGETAYALGLFAAWGPLLAGPASLAAATLWAVATLARTLWRRYRPRD